MAKILVVVSLAAALVGAVSSPANAQCATFSPTVSCSAQQVSPLRTADFGTTQRIVPPTRYKAVPIVPTVPAVPVRDVNAIDCKMAKPVDPSFTSAMPTMSPDTNVRFSGKILPVPACQS